MEQLLTFGLVCPFWASFRNASTVNVHVTYPFPPPTTLYGLLNAARGMPQDWYADREAWQSTLVVESKGTRVETFSKVMKVYEEKRKAEEAAKDKYGKSFFDRTTLIRQKLIGVHYTVYLKARGALLTEALLALTHPHWPLYLGESDDLVDVVSPHLVDVSPQPVQQLHSIIPGIVEGCRLVNVPIRYYQVGNRWRGDYQIYSLPPEHEGIELTHAVLAYPIEGRNVIFNDPNNHSGKTQPNVIRSS